MERDILITGAAGFAGSNQVDKALTDGQSVVAQVRNHSDLANLSEALPSPRLTVEKLDLRATRDVGDLIRTYQPRVIIHLAAVSDVNSAIRNPDETIENNFKSTFNVVLAAFKYSPESTVVLTGSSHEYGIPQEEQPNGINENTSLNPQNPYARSKVMENMILDKFTREGLHIVKARVFNHSGPRRSDKSLDGRLAKEAVEAKLKGEIWTPRIGSANQSRDWQHVNNWNDANIVLSRRGASGNVYNVGSGEPHSLSQFIDALAQELGIQFEIIEDSTLLRPEDPLNTFANVGKLRGAHWKPERSFEDMIKDSVEYWMGKLKE